MMNVLKQAVGIFLLIAGMQVSSHNVLTMIYAVGLEIEGQVGFSNGTVAPAGTLVEVFEGDERLLPVAIREDGVFSYRAERVSDYRFVVNLGDGHVGELFISADDLSDDNGRKGLLDQAQPEIHPDASSLEKMLARQILPLRKDIQALEARQRLVDIIAGIGFIVGIFGLMAWLQSRKVIREASRQ